MYQILVFSKFSSKLFLQIHKENF